MKLRSLIRILPSDTETLKNKEIIKRISFFLGILPKQKAAIHRKKERLSLRKEKLRQQIVTKYNTIEVLDADTLGSVKVAQKRVAMAREAINSNQHFHGLEYKYAELQTKSREINRKIGILDELHQKALLLQKQ